MKLERGAETSKVFEQHYKTSSASFWKRFNGMPDLRGKRVMDFGCGSGGMIHRLMEAGASSAVGIDLSERAITYAAARLEQEWGSAVDIRLGDIANEHFDPVDVIVSQNTLEHVYPLYETMMEVVGRAKPGADLYFGFSPLWYSPYGNHQYPPGRTPWKHLVLGDKIVLDAFRDIAGVSYASIADAGFNKAVPRDFYELFERLPVQRVSLRANVFDSSAKTLLMKNVLSVGKVLGLEKYLTVGIYAHLKKV